MATSSPVHGSSACHLASHSRKELARESSGSASTGQPMPAPLEEAYLLIRLRSESAVKPSRRGPKIRAARSIAWPSVVRPTPGGRRSVRLLCTATRTDPAPLLGRINPHSFKLTAEAAISAVKAINDRLARRPYPATSQYEVTIARSASARRRPRPRGIGLRRRISISP
jgi:hypothetical protein